MGARLRTGIERAAAEHGGVRDVRGAGLMIGVEFASHEAANAVELAAFERGLLVLECGEATIRLCPPLMIDEAAVDTAVTLFGEAMAAAVRPTEGMDETGG
jgi:4-aminobutyrate aminotransferase